MSIILDALRRGRGPHTQRSSPNAAKTDAVLRTLGYGRFSRASPFNRLKRVVGYLTAVLLLAAVLWAIITWVTRYL